MANIRWKKKKSKRGLFSLIIEGDLTIKRLYQQFPELFENKGLIITGADCNIHEVPNVMVPILNNHQVEFELKFGLLWIIPQFVPRLFKVSGFGDSLDSVIFTVQAKRAMEPLVKNLPRIKYKLYQEGFEEDFYNLLSRDDCFISYENIPDLLLVSKDESFIDGVHNAI